MSREVMQQALDALEKFGRGELSEIPVTLLVHNLRAELAKPERVPLTSEQRKKIFEYNTCSGDHGDYYDPYGILKDVEAFYGIKEKPLFADLIATHEGLAEELRAADNIKES
jgi:hypothetical protein